MAGQWKMPPVSRKKRTTKICQTCTLPNANKTASIKVKKAVDAICQDHHDTAVPAVYQRPGKGCQ